MILYNMPFNVEKWMASPSVRDMTRQEQAAYLLLLVECWSRDGYLDRSKIESIKNGGGCQWKKAVESVVFKMFLVEKHEGFGNVSDSFSDRFYNETQLKLFENLVKTEKKRAEIGKLSAQKRWDTHRLPNGLPISPITNNQYPVSNNQYPLKEGAKAPKKAPVESLSETEQRMVADWNELAAEIKLARVMLPLGAKRLAKLRERLKDGMSEHWTAIRKGIIDSDFLRGNMVGNDWRISFDGLINSVDMWRKICQGNYDRPVKVQRALF